MDYLLAPPNLDLSDLDPADAYANKTVRFLRMFPDLDVPPTPLCRYLSFGDDRFDPQSNGWQLANNEWITYLREHWQLGDLILHTFGKCHQATINAFPQAVHVEWAVGYEGVARGTHRIFESHAHRHRVTALLGEQDGRWYDSVIPNFFDPADFVIPDDQEPMAMGEPYLAWMGRWTDRKGPHVARQIADRCDMPLVMAGPGCPDSERDALRDNADDHIGVVSGVDKARFLAGATALLVPTIYFEPFGGVAVEAQLCGTAAITSDWGAFTETVPPCYRFRTLAEAVECVDIARQHDARPEHRQGRAGAARARYSMDAVRPMFEEAFARYRGLYGAGWCA